MIEALSKQQRYCFSSHDNLDTCRQGRVWSCLVLHMLTSSQLVKCGSLGCWYTAEGKEWLLNFCSFSCYTADGEEEGGKGSRAGGGCPHCGVPAPAPAQGTGLLFPSLPSAIKQSVCPAPAQVCLLLCLMAASVPFALTHSAFSSAIVAFYLAIKQ